MFILNPCPTKTQKSRDSPKMFKKRTERKMQNEDF